MSEVVLHLLRHDPARNMARFYELTLCRTLFGEWSLMRRWGRIGSCGRTTFETFVEQGAAQDALQAHERRKRKRGYESAA